ncbi:Protamine-3 [Manis pentadactyla]|nr:Protamine-3 [Manis pentadactyla]
MTGIGRRGRRAEPPPLASRSAHAYIKSIPAPKLVALPPRRQRQPKRAMGSHCARLSTGRGWGHKSSTEKLAACVSQDSFSLSTEGEGQEQGEEEEGEEELWVQGKLLLLEPEQQEEGAERKALWPRRARSMGRRTADL